MKAGLAWHFKKYEEEQEPQDRLTYAAAEQQARAAKLGLWQDANPTAPGDWRQEVKTKRWGPPPPAGTIIGNNNSMKYHRPDCAGYRDMAEKNRVFFATVAEAEAAGYKRAGNCPAEEQAGLEKSSPARMVQPVVSAAPPVQSIPLETTRPVVNKPATVQPEPVPPATVQPDPALLSSNGTAGVNSVEDGQIIGNKKSKVYHLPGCSSYSRVSEKNQVRFESAEAAEKAGFRIAGNCSASKNAKP